MSFELFIAKKQMIKGRRHGFVSLIAVISILGIAVGVMALIVVLAVMSGFDTELKSKIVGVQPHIVLESYGGISNFDQMREQIKSLAVPQIESIAPYVQGQGILRSDQNALGVLVKGVDTASEPMELIRKHLRFGTLDFTNIKITTDKNKTKIVSRAVLGEELAHRLRVGIGDVVTIISPAFDEDPLKSIKRAKSAPFVVSGVFRVGMSDFDSNLVLIDLKEAQALYQLDQRVSGISIRLNQVELADEIKFLIQSQLGADFLARSWIDMNRTFFRALQVEKTVMTILLSLIILVAAFNIIATLIMSVMEKTKDIGILRALGATKGAVKRIFLLQGFTVGFFGVLLGAAAGLALAFNLNPVSDFLERTFGISVFPSDIYYFDQIPAQVNTNDVVLIVSFAFLMSLFAGLYPAHYAAKLNPIQALRYEYPMIKVTDLEKHYKLAGGTLKILRGVSFEINEGDLAFLIGRSGAGKSTLLHLLGGLDRPSGGEIEFEGQNLEDLGERALAEYRNKKVGFVFQFYHLLPELTVKENVELPALIGRKRVNKRSETLLKRVGLWDRRNHLPNELSGGEQQRVAIARALINEPKVIFGDEPTGNLDDETADTIHQLIFELNREGQTFCIVTHEESFARKGNRIFKLHDGLLEAVKN